MDHCHGRQINIGNEPKLAIDTEDKKVGRRTSLNWPLQRKRDKHSERAGHRDRRQMNTVNDPKLVIATEDKNADSE